MSFQSNTTEHTTLGEYLRETRITQGKELAAVAGETKISSRSLQAIEENNFAALPADVFARGFYVLYAKSLLLDPEKVLQMYIRERPRPKKSIPESMLRRGKLAQEVGNMSERPSSMPFSFFGLLVLLMLLLGGVLSWYISWNPATYLSHKLRSLEEPQQIEQGWQSSPASDVFASGTPPVRVQKPQKKQHDIFGLSYPFTATNAEAQQIPKAAVPLSLQTLPYTIPENSPEQPQQ
ncbi:helix-turn-helix domain-containing protein [Desulfocastanea catecholica]